MRRHSNVVVISNDIVPGSEMPVAAPGLRALCLAEGLRAHGVPAEIVVVSGPVSRQWQGEILPPARPGTVILPADRLSEYLRVRTPGVAVLSNSNQIDHIEKAPGVSLVLDFFAPKMLELTYSDDNVDMRALGHLRERKIRAVEMADAFIVNGAKKVPYFLVWILQTDRDLREVELGVVPMPMSQGAERDEPSHPLRLVNAGYLQGWSQHGAWIRVLRRVLDQGGMELRLLAPSHWGQPNATRPSDTIEALASHPAVRISGALRFTESQEFIAQADVSIDLFDWSWEREYAMVTRSVVALASGVSVIHPPFTEVSPVIEEFDAGWLIDPKEEAALEGTLKSLRDNPEEVAKKAEHAKESWRNVFEPKVATTELARIIHDM